MLVVETNMERRSHLLAHVAGAQWEYHQVQGGRKRRSHGVWQDLTADGG